MVNPVVIDFAHCGTTMVAGVLEILGVPMMSGDRHVMKWEDMEAIEALRGTDETFAALVEKRDAAHENWGFKCPGAWLEMDRMQKYLRNPVYLAIFKDPVSVTRRRFGNSPARWLRKLRNTSRQMQRSFDGIYLCRVPVAMFSYQKAILDPMAFVDRVAHAAGIETNVRQLVPAARYIQPNMRGPRAPYPSVREFLE